jgi:hypothetical protein
MLAALAAHMCVHLAPANFPRPRLIFREQDFEATAKWILVQPVAKFTDMEE